MSLHKNELFFFFLIVDDEEEDNSLPDSSFLNEDSVSPAHRSEREVDQFPPSSSLRRSDVYETDNNPDHINNNSKDNNSSRKNEAANFLHEKSKLSTSLTPAHIPQHQTHPHGQNDDHRTLTSSLAAKSETVSFIPKLGPVEHHNLSAITQFHAADSILYQAEHSPRPDNTRNLQSHGTQLETVSSHISKIPEAQRTSI